ncbi:MAG: EAL domain-containing protein, partial [bacterium]
EGDKLLKAFALVLEQTFEYENCCHINADRFAIFAKEAGLEGKLKRVFEKAKSLNGGKSLPVRVGVYLSSLEDVSASSACDRAKMACDAIPFSDASIINYYSSKMRNEIKKRRYILSHIDRAIEEKWIQIYFQPIIRAVNEKVCDVEALSRWVDPVQGFLSPVDFIPALEDAGLIYKLDLYMVEQLVVKLRHQMDAGYPVVPHSINLSRSDFDACDIVEEIRKRVDAAGVPRDRITIEITESIIGSDFDFIKVQVERFRKLGFPVWMDDFGSGYSSLDVLQSIKFDLLKFDMSFMRKLDEGENGKIILTELMKMATALGVDTICEGVETEAQVRFLQEIGCSKLQGYYYSKPLPLETVVERYKAGIQVGFENPEEAAYYETIGRINLYDLAVIASGEAHAFHNSFNTIPMGIIEVRGDQSRFVRSNQSYRNFVRDNFGIELVNEGAVFHKSSSVFMRNVVNVCCEKGLRSVYDERMPD